MRRQGADHRRRLLQGVPQRNRHRGLHADYNSYGLSLTAHEPFESTEKAIQEEKDIVSRQVAVRYNMKRQLVGDTDQGRQIRQRIRELKELIEAYRTAQLKELL